MPAPTQQTRKAPRWLFWAIPLAIVAIVAGVLLVPRLAPADLTITGEVLLHDTRINTTGNSCRGSGGYDDLREGAQVVVTDATGKSIGIGTLGTGVSNTNICTWEFSVTVPAGGGIYGVEVSHRGKLQYSEADLAGRPLKLSIGS